MSTFGVAYLNSKHSPVKVAGGVIVAASVLLLLTKPKLTYDARGASKTFGTAQHETLIPAWMALTALGLTAYTAVNVVAALDGEGEAEGV
jgi:hypothetical protein